MIPLVNFHDRRNNKLAYKYRIFLANDTTIRTNHFKKIFLSLNLSIMKRNTTDV